MSNFKESMIRDKKYLNYFQHLPCCYRGFREHECCGDVVAAHIRLGNKCGTGLKPSDDNCIPLCFACHHMEHNKGSLFFFGKTLPLAQKLAHDLYKAYYEDKRDTKMRKVIEQFMWDIRK